MTALSTFFSTMVRCLLVFAAMAILGITWGCGEMPPQATPDEAAEARIKKAQEANIKFMEKMEKKEAMQRASKVKKR